ncbi:MAG: glycosyltransferase family 9 protein [bacterium]
MRVRLLKILDATIGLFLCWAGGWVLYWVRREASPHELVTADIRRILVIRPGGLGDMILVQPMLEKLHAKYPLASIDLVCERRNQEIMEFSRSAATVLTYDSRPFRLIGKLMAGRYDLAIDTEQFHYFSAVMALLSRAPFRIGYKINPGRNPIYTHLISYDLEGYEADEFLKLLRPLGISTSAEVKGCLKLPDVILPDDLETVLDEARSGSTGLLLIHVGSSSRYKTWDISNFAGLVRGLGKDRAIRIGLVGGRKDSPVAALVAQRSGLTDRISVMAGRLTLRQTARLLGEATLFVGGDSGLAHLAATYGVPSVVLFGPSDFRKWSREGQTSVVVRKEMACSPCFIFGYHKYCRSITCMESIGVRDVLDACRKLMSLGS